jgi:hypothetical protein
MVLKKILYTNATRKASTPTHNNGDVLAKG